MNLYGQVTCFFFKCLKTEVEKSIVLVYWCVSALSRLVYWCVGVLSRLVYLCVGVLSRLVY